MGYRISLESAIEIYIKRHSLEENKKDFDILHINKLKLSFVLSNRTFYLRVNSYC